MRAAAADVEDYLGQALEMLGTEHEEGLTPARADRAAGIAGSYVELAKVAVERFEDAARGA